MMKELIREKYDASLFPCDLRTSFIKAKEGDDYVYHVEC